MTQAITLLLGDCVERMRELPEGGIQILVADPPYGLEFMSKDFDKLGDGEAQQLWHLKWLRAAYRVLEPGGVIKAFSAPRTFHRLAAAMELAGFTELRLEAWAYGSGFPKSLDIGAAAGEAWTGWGSALKPAWEPFVVGTKPISR
jgi:site-specific DNA-methyltransferase (adenine-specific)